MTLTIELSPMEEASLAAAARQAGIEPAELARKLVTEHLPSPTAELPPVDEQNAASIALLQAWLAEDATDDPEEIQRAQEELAEFQQAVNAERDRAGARRIYP